jgi:hypothetical protein
VRTQLSTRVGPFRFTHDLRARSATASVLWKVCLWTVLIFIVYPVVAIVWLVWQTTLILWRLGQLAVRIGWATYRTRT